MHSSDITLSPNKPDHGSECSSRTRRAPASPHILLIYCLSRLYSQSRIKQPPSEILLLRQYMLKDAACLVEKDSPGRMLVLGLGRFLGWTAAIVPNWGLEGLKRHVIVGPLWLGTTGAQWGAYRGPSEPRGSLGLEGSPLRRSTLWLEPGLSFWRPFGKEETDWFGALVKVVVIGIHAILDLFVFLQPGRKGQRYRKLPHAGSYMEPRSPDI